MHEKPRPARTPSRRRSPLRLARYARPYRGRLALAAAGLALASLIGFFNLLLLKPAVEVLAGDGTARIVTTAQSNDASADRGRRRAARGLGAPGRFLQPLERRWNGLIAPLEQPFVALNAWFESQIAADRTRALWIIALALVALAALKGLIDFLCQLLLARTGYGLVADLREDLFRKVIAQDYLYFARASTGWLESRIQSDVAALRRAVEVFLRNGCQAPFQLLFLTILLLGLSIRLTLIGLLVALVVAAPLLLLARIVKRVTRQAKRQADRLSAGLEESLRNYPIVKFFQSEGVEVEKFARRNRQLLALYLKNRLAQYGSAPLTQLAAAAGRSAVLIAGGYLIFAGQMEFSTLAVYLVALTRFYGPGRALSRSATTWPAMQVSAERMVEILDLAPAVIEERDALPIDRVREAIEFRSVSFAYENQDALRDVTCRIEAGRVVALVGPSGAGKSTLVALLARLFDPTAGAILIDGVDLRRLRLADLRRLIGAVTQDTILFNDTVARNIAYPDPAPDAARVVEAARAAQAHDFILGLDGGAAYDTLIGQAGQRLSGGQRQRLAIARAFYRDPQILIFDEATSALDEPSQALVQQAVQRLFEGRTVLVIAHRLSTVRRADEILVLHAGRLVERGTHETLLAQGGVYASLHRISRDADRLRFAWPLY